MAEQAEFMLQRGTIVVPSWAGCGVQFNQHVYAPNTGLREERFADLERKLGVLAPQFVRIFYYDAAEGVSSAGSRHTAEQKPYWDSFVRTVKLADQVAATVNITWQSGVNFFPTAQGRERAMSRFADVLETLVTTAGVTKLDWVTIQNEPNTNPPIDKKTGKRPPKVVTVDRLADIYRKLHQKLEAKGLREQIHLMGGDLLEGGKEFDEVTHGKKVTLRPNPLHHKLWFTYMSDNYADILDAYSAHMYWDYQDTKRLNSRLNDTWDIVQGLKHRRPLYITEYGVRSATRDQPVHGKIPIDPGNFKDGTPIGQTNIAAFQQAWFQDSGSTEGLRRRHQVRWPLRQRTTQTKSKPGADYTVGPPGAGADGNPTRRISSSGCSRRPQRAAGVYSLSSRAILRRPASSSLPSRAAPAS